jgi:hypothetical protein
MMKITGAILTVLTLLIISPPGLVVEGSKALAPAQAKSSAWVIEMSRDGGMRPRRESVQISSEGWITVTSEHLSQGKRVVDCTLKEKLSNDELLKIKEAVRTARLSMWQESYDDPKHPVCCDQPTTRLTVRRGAGRSSAKNSHSTSWYPGSSSLRPSDLVKVAELAQALWNKTSERCGN